MPELCMQYVDSTCNAALLQERGLAISKSFKGVFSLGGRMHGKDCAVSSIDINGKVSLLHRKLLIGSGNALESACTLLCGTRAW